MRLLADENFPLPTIEALRRAGHDVMRARTDCPSTKDAALLDRAEAGGRILLTLDKDFWQLAIQRRRPLWQSGVILFRVHPAIPEDVTPLVLRTVGADEGWGGHASVVTVDRVLMVLLGNPGTR
jgi:predicted nuclease of predicted toxin-antitoxin system